MGGESKTWANTEKLLRNGVSIQNGLNLVDIAGILHSESARQTETERKRKTHRV